MNSWGSAVNSGNTCSGFGTSGFGTSGVGTFGVNGIPPRVGLGAATPSAASAPSYCPPPSGISASTGPPSGFAPSSEVCPTPSLYSYLLPQAPVFHSIAEAFSYAPKKNILHAEETGR